MIEYSCGFLFFRKFIDGVLEDHVLLILKNKPEWQAGLYNGIGGKVESGETALAAQVREFFEEAGVITKHWQEFASIVNQDVDFKVTFFFSHFEGIPDFQSKTTEEVKAFPLSQLPPNLISSLRYLIPLALDKDVLNSMIVVSK